MFRLPESLAAWNAPDFSDVLRRELERDAIGHLPLQAGLSASSVALEEGCRVMVLRAEEAGPALRVRIGVFYAGLVAGCNCADDPTPVGPQPEYCEVDILIDRATAAARAILAD